MRGKPGRHPGSPHTHLFLLLVPEASGLLLITVLTGHRHVGLAQEPGLVLILEVGALADPRARVGSHSPDGTLRTHPARLPCPYQRLPPPGRLATLVPPAQEQGSTQQQHRHRGQGQDHQGGLHHLLRGRGGSQGATRLPGPREPAPHFSAGAPHGAGTPPHTEFREGGTLGFQPPSAGPSLLVLGPPSSSHGLRSASRFPDQDPEAKGRGPVVGVGRPPTLPHPTHRLRPRPPAPGRAACWCGCARRGTC